MNIEIWFGQNAPIRRRDPGDMPRETAPEEIKLLEGEKGGDIPLEATATGSGGLDST